MLISCFLGSNLIGRSAKPLAPFPSTYSRPGSAFGGSNLGQVKYCFNT